MFESDANVYSSLLVSKGHGYPLWVPEPDDHPARNNGTTIGDVGMIFSDGSFDILFDYFLPSNHSVNASTVPDDFVPFTMDLDAVSKEALYHQAGASITSIHVQSDNTSSLQPST